MENRLRLVAIGSNNPTVWLTVIIISLPLVTLVTVRSVVVHAGIAVSLVTPATLDHSVILYILATVITLSVAFVKYATSTTLTWRKELSESPPTATAQRPATKTMGGIQPLNNYLHQFGRRNKGSPVEIRLIQPNLLITGVVWREPRAWIHSQMLQPRLIRKSFDKSNVGIIAQNSTLLCIGKSQRKASSDTLR
jgi:hypothetical protein